MLVIERVAGEERACQLSQDVGEKAVMQMNDRLTAVFARPHQPDRDAVGIGIGVELRVAAKIAEIGFVGKIHRDFGFVGDWMQ